MDGAARVYGRAPLTSLGSGLAEQPLDLLDDRGVVGEQDRVQAHLAGGRYVGVVVVDEHGLPCEHAEALADQSVASGVGLADPALVRVDDLVDEALEAVGLLLAFPG